MNTKKPVYKDERTELIENRSYGLGFKIMIFLLLLDGVIRGVMYHDSCWDLLLIVMLGSGAASFYQIKENMWGVNTSSRIFLSVVIAISVAVVSVGFVLTFF